MRRRNRGEPTSTTPMSTPNGKNSGHAALQPARRADPDQMTHDEPEIEATRMNQEALQDVRVAAQMGAPHPARVVEMRKRAFEVRRVGASGGGRVAPASGDDCQAPGPRDPSTNHVAPCPARTRRTGHGVQVDQGLIAVIPLITDDLFQRLPIVNVGLRGCSAAAMAVSMIVVVSPTSAPCSVTATIAPVSMSTALGFVRQMRAAIFHLRDLRIGIVGVRPVCVQVFFFRFRSVAPDPRAWASRSPRPSRDPPETPGSSRRCPGGRCCASPRSPRASWRQSRWSCPSDGRPRRVVVAHVKTVRCVSRSIKRRVRAIVE